MPTDSKIPEPTEDDLLLVPEHEYARTELIVSGRISDDSDFLEAMRHRMTIRRLAHAERESARLRERVAELEANLKPMEQT